jgi:general stress protein 26
MSPDERQTILAYLRAQRLGVVSTLAASGAPQAALVGIAVTGALDIIFDTVFTSRKHANLAADPRAAVTFGGHGEQTLQCEGYARRVDLDDERDRPYLETYYAAWPDGLTRREWPTIAYWRITPTWVRYSDYERGPLIIESSLA